MSTRTEPNRRPELIIAGLVLASSGLATLVFGADSTELLLGVAGGLVAAGIVVGTYMLGRYFGHPESHAVAEAAVSFGVVFLLAVTFRLLYTHGSAQEPSALGVATVLGGAGLATAVVILLIVALERFGPSPA